MKIKPKKWSEFQHYKDGSNVTWVKLHMRLLDDFEFQGLPVESRALAPMLWLIAGQHPEGIIDASPETLAFRLRIKVSEVEHALSPLIGKGFFDVVEFPRPSLDTVYTASTPNINNINNIPRVETPLVALTRDGDRVLKAKQKTEALQILEFLNGKARKHFRPVAANLKFIEGRLAEGVTAQDLKTLIVLKCRDWLGTDQAKYLRPETLFNPTKCNSYLGEIAPEDRSCNAPPATETSEPAPSPAHAGGNPPIETMPRLH